MQFEGTLYTYEEESRRTAFESGPLDSTKAVVFIGGLGDGFNACPFLDPLQYPLAEDGWSFVQVNLSSSYTGYGSVDLQTDCDELDALVDFLRTKKNKEKIVFMGHSTGTDWSLRSRELVLTRCILLGSQDCYWHNKNGKNRVDGYILQAPVSDREAFSKAVGNKYNIYLSLADTMVKDGRARDYMPRAVCEDPITASRFLSLYAPGYVICKRNEPT